MSEPRSIPGVTFPPPEPHQVNGAVNPNVRHERTDVDTRAVLWFAAALAAGIVIVLLVLWGLFALFLRGETERKKSQFPLASRHRDQRSPADELPPAPRLEGLSPKGLQQPLGRVFPPTRNGGPDIGGVGPSSAREQAERQDGELNGYGWVEGKENQVAHIPIEEAIKRFASKLPVRRVEAGRPRNDVREAPSSSASGRTQPRYRP
jgi:hypothetical protein